MFLGRLSMTAKQTLIKRWSISSHGAQHSGLGGRARQSTANTTPWTGCQKAVLNCLWTANSMDRLPEGSSQLSVGGRARQSTANTTPWTGCQTAVLHCLWTAAHDSPQRTQLHGQAARRQFSTVCGRPLQASWKCAGPNLGRPFSLVITHSDLELMYFKFSFGVHIDNSIL